MLAVFILLISAGVLLGTFGQPEHRSYMIELAVAALPAGLFIYFDSRTVDRPHKARRHGALVTGIGLTLLCFALNLAWVLYCRVEPTVDYYTNYRAAVDVATGNWRNLNYLYIGLFPHIFGYAVFLSRFILIFGESPLLVPLLNVVLTAGTGIMIYCLCLRRISFRAAVFAYLMWSICPSKLLYNTMVMPEPVYTFMLVLFFVLLCLAERVSKRNGCSALCPAFAALVGAVSGAVLCVINAMRPLGAIVLIALFIWLVLLRGEELRSRRGWLVWAAFIICLLLSYRGLGSRWSDYEAWRLRGETAKIPAYSIYVGLDRESGGSFSDEAMDRLMNYRYDEENGSAVWAQQQMLEDTKARLKAEGINVFELFRVKLPKLLGNDEGGAFYSAASLTEREYKLLSAASNVFYYFIIILCIYGAALMPGRSRGDAMLMLPLFCVGLTLAHMIVEVSGRYKYCMVALFIVIASYALHGRGNAES